MLDWENNRSKSPLTVRELGTGCVAGIQVVRQGGPDL